MLVHDTRIHALFGDNELLAAAKHLVGLPGIEHAQVPEVTYVHLLFDQHEVVYAENAWSESFQPGQYVLDGLGQDQRDEILTLFPELAFELGDDFEAARRVMKRHEAALLRL